MAGIVPTPVNPHTPTLPSALELVVADPLLLLLVPLELADEVKLPPFPPPPVGFAKF